jgi:glycosyltransferase involved in cell wall biosynthesis
MFKFYFIGEHNFRKNIIDLVIAFSLAFDYTENVCLVIKTNKSGSSPQGLLSALEQEINDTKQKLGISKKYKKEIIIPNSLSYKDIIGLHNSCDCFVAPSYGEAFCRPAAEALILGKTPIVNQNTGMSDYINNTNGFLVNSHKVPIIQNTRTLSAEFDIYNANEHWYKIDIYDLINKMQLVYSMFKNKDKALNDKKEVGLKAIDQFSYENIGKKLCI